MTVWKRLPARLRRWSVRASNVKFTVTAAGIVRNSEGKVLIIKHRFRPGSGWGIPGGFVEAGEQAEAALRRELCEEVGLELEQLRIFAARTFERQSQIEIVFLAKASGDPRPRSIEVERVEWFSPQLLPDALPSDQKKLIESALQVGAEGRD
jgi:8-oxo-dGTP diphosphatase